MCAIFLAFASATAVLAAQRQQDAKKLSQYTAIVVQAFTVQKSPATKDVPIGLESALQSDAVTRLQAAALFYAVINAAPAPADPAGVTEPLDLRVNAAQPITADSSAGRLAMPEAAGHSRRLILNGTIVAFKKGNRAARYFAGFGAGESKLKVHFALVDAKTGAEVMSWDQTGTFKGMAAPFGGGSGKVDQGDAGSVVKGLVKKIEENR